MTIHELIGFIRDASGWSNARIALVLGLPAGMLENPKEKDKHLRDRLLRVAEIHSAINFPDSYEEPPCQIRFANPNAWFDDDPLVKAKAIERCVRCPMLDACYAAAADQTGEEIFGVWAGVDYGGTVQYPTQAKSEKKRGRAQQAIPPSARAVAAVCSRFVQDSYQIRTGFVPDSYLGA